MTISNLMKMAESSLKGLKTLWEKGEIACCEQFLLFSLCFQKICTAKKKQGLFGKLFTTLSYENILSVFTILLTISTKYHTFLFDERFKI